MYSWMQQFLQQNTRTPGAKAITFAPEKCTGCRSCELACSFHKNQEFRPSAARISVLTWESAGVSVPITCLQCDSGACMRVCPTGAIEKTSQGAVVIKEEHCIQCKVCIVACPFGNIGYDQPSGKINKCDLCSGDPVCVKFCPSGAIAYEEVTVSTQKKRKTYAEKFKELLQEVSE